MLKEVWRDPLVWVFHPVFSKQGCKTEREFSCGFLSFSTSPAWLTSTTGFVSSQQHCYHDVPFTLQKWTDLLARFNTCISLTNSQALQIRPVRELHTFYISGNNKDKDFVTYLILSCFLDFSNSFAISQSSICCAGELLSECRSGDFPPSITINRPTSSLFH